MKNKITLALILLLSISIAGKAQKKDSSITAKSIIQNTTISGQYFMAYNYNDDSELHNFLLKRGYFTIKTKLTEDLSVRYTQDITLDKEGSDLGNVEMRLKYLYLKAKLDKIVKNSYIEVGLVHRPWVDFEQHINPYRVQGSMFLDKRKVVSSADFGVMLAGLIGGKIDKKYQKEVNKKEAGRYGSYAIGVYNGGGYHAIEENSDKTLETRLTIRPLPDFMPGLQLSHGFAYGRANVHDSLPQPKFLMNVYMLSSESKHHKFTAQYYNGVGDYGGKYIDDNYKSYNNEGFSVFGELNIPSTKFAVFSRYDNFKTYKATTDEKESIIAGVAYKFLKNKILIDYQQDKSKDAITNYWEFAIEIGF